MCIFALAASVSSWDGSSMNKPLLSSAGAAWQGTQTGAPSRLVLNSSSPGQLMWGCRKDHSCISRTLDSSLRSKISAPKEVGVMSGSLYQTHCVTLGRLPDKTQPGELQRFWRPAQHRSGLGEARPESTSSSWFGWSPVRFGTFGRCRGKDLSFHRKDKSFHRNE